MRLHGFICALAVVVCSGLWAVVPAQAARPGIYEVWGNRSDVAHLRYVRGGQIALEWKTVEPTRGHFDWSGLRAQLNAYHAIHKPATVQINSTTSKPAWLWNLIARCGTTQGQQIPQYWDPLYLKLQHELLSSFARALKSYSHRGTIALVRSAPNAIGTELTTVPAGVSCTRATDGHSVAQAWSRSVRATYYRNIMGCISSLLAPAIHVALRTEVFTTDGAPLSWLGRRDAWIMDTASDIDPNPTRDTFDVFARHWDRAGRAQAYWEPFSYVGKQNLASWNYWRILLELDKGVSYIAVYGQVIRHGGDPQYGAAFRFANRYAGRQLHPGRSPGAFIALRQGTGRMAGNLERFMKQIDAQRTSIALDSNNGRAMIGPAAQRYGRFARRIVAGTAQKAMFFRLNGTFKHGVRDHAVRIRVTYLDQGGGAFVVKWGRAGRCQHTVHKHGTGRWRTVTIKVRRAGFHNRLSHRSDITLKALGSSGTDFHMVEVRVHGR